MKSLKKRKKLLTPEPSETKSRRRKNERRCIASGQSLSGDDPAIRFVLGPDAELIADLAQKLPGRGAWVTSDKTLLFIALKKNLFNRAFGRQRAVTLSDDQIVGAVEQGLRKRCLSALGMARRSGALITGFEKVAAAAKAGNLVAYACASDASEDGRKKILSAIAVRNPACRIVDSFSGEELDQALGGYLVAHAGLVDKPVSNMFLKDVDRLSGFL